MAKSSITGGEHAPAQADGKDIDLLGPSDSSDSGSDVSSGSIPGSGGSDTDRQGTGERGSVDLTSGEPGADIRPDRIVRNPDQKGGVLDPSEASDLADEQGPSIDA